MLPQLALTHTQLEIGLGAGGNEGITGQQRQVFFLDIQRVGHDTGNGETTCLGHHGKGRLAELLIALFYLLGGLGHVQMDTAAVLTGRFYQPSQHLGRADIGGVGTDAQMDHLVAGVGRQQLLGLLQFWLGVAAKAKDGVGEIAAQAQFAGGTGDVLTAKVVVGKGGDAVLCHLGAGQFGTPVDVLLGHLALERPELPVEPVVDVYILSDAAEDVHGGVGVQYDQAGGEKFAGAVDALGARRTGDRRADLGDLAALYQQVGAGGYVAHLVDERDILK